MSQISLFDAGPPPPCPAGFNLARYVLGQGAAEKVALTLAADEVTRLTYTDLRARVAQAAGALTARTAPGDRVILRIGHEVAFPIWFLAATGTGRVAVPVSPMLTAEELAHIAADTEAALTVLGDRLSAPGPCLDARATGEAASFAATEGDDLAYIVYTSGSSGRPKGVAHAHRAVWARRMMWDGWYGLTPDDVMMHAGAFNWTYTLGAGLMDPWAIGASTLIYAGPRDPAIWPSLAEAHGATIFAAAPGVYRQLLATGAPLEGFAQLRHGLAAGETLPQSMRDEWERLTGKPIYEALGMTEISTYLSSSPSAPHRRGLAGRPQRGRRLALLPLDGGDQAVALGEPGVIALSRRDPGLMLGYWRDEAGTEAAHRGEWFTTGDVGRMDEDGYIAFEGRSDDMMNALGYRVAPEEVERALLSHPAVTAAAAVELPVRADLSLIAVFYTHDAEDPGEDALRAHCEGQLAAYKIPRIFTALEDLPRNPNGKVKRKALIETHRRDNGA